jgi:hypothetical protein
MAHLEFGMLCYDIRLYLKPGSTLNWPGISGFQSTLAKASCMDVKPKAIEVTKSIFNGKVQIYAYQAFQEKNFSGRQ